jgi:hypothetical protein
LKRTQRQTFFFYENQRFSFGQQFARAAIKTSMRTFLAVVLWCLLFVVCWPIAILVLIFFPIIWLILLPFRIVGLTLSAVFKLIGAILMLPFRVIKAI